MAIMDIKDIMAVVETLSREPRVVYGKRGGFTRVCLFFSKYLFAFVPLKSVHLTEPRV